MRPRLLVNTAAGTAAQFADGSLPERLGKGFAAFGYPVDIRAVTPATFAEALHQACRTDGPVIMAGGDGSVSAAVQVFAGTGIPLGIIPMGTYNLLGQDLGMSTDLEEAIGQIVQARPIAIDLGRIGQRYFHTLAGLGFFSRVARHRAEIRQRLPGAKLFVAAASAIRSLTTGGNLEIEVDDGSSRQSFSTPAVLITNNLLDASTWRRPRLDAGLLEINVTRGDIPFPLLRGGLAAVLGSWRESSEIVTWTSSAVSIHFRRPRVFLSLDGEVSRPRTPLRFECVPRALTCLAAPAAEEQPQAYGNARPAPDGPRKPQGNDRTSFTLVGVRRVEP